MTKSISSRSAKGIPKTAEEPDSNGTLPTDRSSEDISEGLVAKKWMVTFTDGSRKTLTIFGGRGRVSFTSPRTGRGGEARFYRNETTKTYEAVYTGIANIVSDRVSVDDLPKTTPPKDEPLY